ncbi:MAG: lipid-binding SYLF domain-containing protein [Desulfobulbaceae bacterium]
MTQHKNQFILFIVMMVWIMMTAATARTEDFSKPDELVLKGEAVFKSFMADPNMEWFRDNVGNAKGIFIVPQMLRGGFFIGGSGGSGALLALDRKTGKWSYPAFYTMGSVSFGMQIGADTSEIILMVMTDKGMEAMLSTEFKLGGDVSLAAGPVGASAKAQTADILAYGRSKGVFVGIAIDGAVIAPRYEWNNSYYGKDVLLVDILINQTASNPQADNLREALPKARLQ